MKPLSRKTSLWLTASLASVVALNLSCGKNEKPKNEAGDTPVGTNVPATLTVANEVQPLPMAVSADSNAVSAALNPAARSETGSLPVAPANPPVALPETNGVATVEAPVVIKVVEMPTNPPVAPKDFYSDSFVTNQIRRVDNDNDHFFTARLGYEHSGFGNDRDSLYAGVKFYSHNDQLRARNEKLRWFIPDATFELSHQALPQPDLDAGGGLQLRSDFLWPWVNWTTKAFARENCACAFARPMTFAVGPVVTLGFDKTFDGSEFRFARYGGVRLAVNRYAFVQYSWGRTDDFGAWQQELLAEMPFYISRDEQVRYGLRGEWIRGALSEPDYYQIGAFVEMPLNFLVRPCEWASLVPFAK